jgi:hypothetical protein
MKRNRLSLMALALLATTGLATMGGDCDFDVDIDDDGFNVDIDDNDNDLEDFFEDLFD